MKGGVLFSSYLCINSAALFLSPVVQVFTVETLHSPSIFLLLFYYFLVLFFYFNRINIGEKERRRGKEKRILPPSLSFLFFVN